MMKLSIACSIRRALKKTGKTVVLATNQLYFVQSADVVLYVSDGRIAEAGPFQKLMASGGQFATMMREVQVDEEEKALEMAPSTVGGNSGLAGVEGTLGSTQGVRLTTDEASSQVGLVSMVSA